MSIYSIVFVILASVTVVVRCNITKANELNCNFEEPCYGWFNGTEDRQDTSGWKVSPQLILDAWHSLPRAAQGVYFGHVSSSLMKGPERFLLYSDYIPCLLSPGYLTFYYWKNTFLSGIFANWNLPTANAMPELSVSIVTPPHSRNRRIIYRAPNFNQWGWRTAAIEIPQSDEPFQLLFEAGVQSLYDIVGVDDIQFRGLIDATLCEMPKMERQKLISQGFTFRQGSPFDRFPSFQQFPFVTSRPPSRITSTTLATTTTLMTTTTRATTTTSAPTTTARRRFVLTRRPTKVDPNKTKPTKPHEDDDIRRQRQPKPDTGINCPAVDCDFEGHSCAYEGTDNDNGAWVIMSGRIGNPVTGIPGAAFGDYFAVAHNNDPNTTQLLRSQLFRTTGETVLSFWYYFANAISGRFRLCDLTFANCIWEVSKQSIGANSRRWRRAKVPIPAGKHQLYFSAEELNAHYFSAVDHISLRTINLDEDRAHH